MLTKSISYDWVGMEWSHLYCHRCIGWKRRRTETRFAPLAKADFMDSLETRWIYERGSVQAKEVAAVFFRFLGIEINPSQIRTSSSPAWHAIGPTLQL